MFCRKCGNLIPDDSDFCFKCGTAVEMKEEKAINSQLWVYNNAIKEFDNAQTIEELDKVESTFKELGDYKNSAEYVEKCRVKKFPILYDSTISLLKNAKSTQEFQDAENNLKYLGNYKDSEQLLEKCRYDLKLSKYNDAYIKSKTAKTPDDFLEAEKMFRALGDFEDAAQLADGCLESNKEKRYAAADEAMKKAESVDSFAETAKEFEALGNYKDAAIKADKARKSTALLDKYNEAYEKMQAAFSTNSNSETLSEHYHPKKYSQELKCSVCTKIITKTMERCPFCSEPNPYYQKSSSPSSANASANNPYGSAKITNAPNKNTNNQSADNDEDGYKTFASVLGIIYAIVVFIEIIILFGSGDCTCTGRPFEIEYYVPAAQTFVGVVFIGAALVGILCLIYKLTHKK